MRKVAVVTGNRAEFGVLKKTLKAIEASDRLKLQLCVTGAHLSASAGNTLNEIEAEGLLITAKVPIQMSDTEAGVTNSMGEVLSKFGELFLSLKPDIVVVLGDRYEIFAVASAAVAQHIPLAHIHGGEISEGSIDNQWRHAITKLANLHFCATDEFRNRIVQMGEQPQNVSVAGALGLENINSADLMSRSELENSLNFAFRPRNILFTYHPETAFGVDRIRGDIQTVLKCLAGYENTGFILTYPNADLGHEIIVEELIDFQQQNAEHVLLVKSLGAKRYLSTLQFVDVVVGNSSSGLVEVPSFHIATVNIGNRQNGRLAPESVIQCGYDGEEIKDALDKAFSNDFRNKIGTLKNPYDKGAASVLIKQQLEQANLENIIFKKFNDLPQKQVG